MIGIFKGMGVTFKHIMRRSFTVQYPEEKRIIAPRYRGALKLRGVIGEFLEEVPISDAMPPCQNACPAHVDARGYVGLIAQGRFLDAYTLHMETNPLPAICGRICPHPCETDCRRGQEDEPITINALKRFMADYELAQRRKGNRPPIPKPAPSKNKRVAVIGAGPAGLSAAYYLALWGYQVTIFEKLAVAGGMLTTAIPPYRLPRDIIQAEIETILSLGVELKLKTPVENLEALFKDGYQAIFIGVGAPMPMKLGIPGEELKGVMPGEPFLTEVCLGKKTRLGKNVAVVGGGNTAIDCARTAVRQGAKKTSVVYRRTRAEMPAQDVEIEDAIDEGVDFEYLVAPTKVIGKRGKVAGLECTRMELGEPDASGRRRPIPIEGSEFIMEVDTVISAISRLPNLDWLKDSRVEISRRGTIVTDPKTGATTRGGVFAGGDASLGPSVAIEAIGAGRRAAIGIDQYLSGSSQTTIIPPMGDLAKEGALKLPYSGAQKREHGPKSPPSERISNFKEVESSFSENIALIEAQRCLSCYIHRCIGCGICSRICPVQCIKVIASQNGARKIDTYNLAINECIFCGICAEFCPTKTLVHTIEYELAQDDQANFLYDKDRMLRRQKTEDRRQNKENLTSDI